MKVVVFLKRGASLAYENARVTPASMATPYYAVVMEEGLIYFDKDAVEHIVETKEEK